MATAASAGGCAQGRSRGCPRSGTWGHCSARSPNLFSLCPQRVGACHPQGPAPRPQCTPFILPASSGAVSALYRGEPGAQTPSARAVRAGASPASEFAGKVGPAHRGCGFSRVPSQRGWFPEATSKSAHPCLSLWPPSRERQAASALATRGCGRAARHADWQPGAEVLA